MAKTGDVAPDVTASELFPLLALPSKWKGWRRFLRPFPILSPRNNAHYTARSHLQRVKADWAALSSAQQTAWNTWANANKPDDGIWQTPFSWTGRLAHAFCNMHLLFIGAALRSTAPSVTPHPGVPITSYYWTNDPGNQLAVSWSSLGDSSLSVLIALRLFAQGSGLKTSLYAPPIAAVAHPDHSYQIVGPPGTRAWWCLYVLHNTQGVLSPVTVLRLDKGETI